MINTFAGMEIGPVQGDRCFRVVFGGEGTCNDIWYNNCGIATGIARDLGNSGTCVKWIRDWDTRHTWQGEMRPGVPHRFRPAA